MSQNIVVQENDTLTKSQEQLRSMSKGERDKAMKALQKKDREMVKGKFIFHEVPGGRMSFSFKKWKDDPVERFDLDDGQIYTLPLAVAKHLNKECKYPIHAFAKDESDAPSQKVGQWVRRCSFQSLEFVDIDDLTPEGEGNK